jgi:hypothetical protein
MKRTASALMVLAALGGCVSTGSGPGMGGGWGSMGGGPPSVPGVQGPWGQPVAMAAPYTAVAPSGEEAAREMMARSVPLELMQTGAFTRPGAPSGIMLAGGPAMPGGMSAPGAMPPPSAMSAPSMPFQPFVAGAPGGRGYPPGAVAAVGAISQPQPNRFPSRRTEVSFTAPYGMKVSWFAPTANGQAGFASNNVVTPGRYNFVQGAVYRLKLSDIPNRPGMELYPTLEVVPSNLKTDAFLAHSAVPVSFTNEDLDQVAAGNFLVKVIYLPDPQFQDLAVAGPEEIVSSRLEPGVDPIAEAYRRGSILLVVRLGNIDLELANSPGMDAPGQNQQHAPVPGMPMHGMPMPGMPGMPMPGMPGMPHGMMPPSGPMMGVPSMQTMPMTPYAPSGVPAMTIPGQTSRLPEPGTLQATQFSGGSTTAQKAAQPSEANSADKNSDKKTSNRSWWWGGGDSDKK